VGDPLFSRHTPTSLAWISFGTLIALCACGGGNVGTVDTKPRFVGTEESPLQSNEILARDQKVSRAQVRHILIGWGERSGSYQGGMDKRAANRSREQADELALALYKRVVAGESLATLMAQYSEDPGSASSGRAYEVVMGGQMAFEFRRLALRLEVGEVGLVVSKFGWHIMRRTE